MAAWCFYNAWQSSSDFHIYSIQTHASLLQSDARKHIWLSRNTYNWKTMTYVAQSSDEGLQDSYYSSPSNISSGSYSICLQ